MHIHLLYIAFVALAYARQMEEHWESESTGQDNGPRIDDAQYKSLLLQHVLHTGEPPEDTDETDVPFVMDKIYNLLVDGETGQVKQSTAFDIDFVHGLEDHYETERRMQFWFNISSINQTEDVIDCYFHIYKRRPTDRSRMTQHLITVTLHKITDPDKLYNEDGTLGDGAEVLEVTQVSAYTEDWIIFNRNLKDTVKHWIRHPKNNHGLLLTATDREHNHVNGTHIDFVQRGELPLTKQPMFIIYADQVKKKGGKHKRRHQSNINFIIENHLNESPMRSGRRGYRCEGLDEVSCFEIQMRQKRSLIITDPDDEDLPQNSKNKRQGKDIGETDTRRKMRHSAGQSDISADKDADSNNRFCKIRPLYISFKALGWSKWIVAPKGLNANFCDGSCPFPLTSSLTISNHAVLQSMSNYYHPSEVKAPCCVPRKLARMSILYHQASKTITMRNYDDMIVEGCGCQ